MDDGGAPDGTSPQIPPEFERFLRSLFGDRSDEVMRALRAADVDPRAFLETTGLPDGAAGQAFLLDRLRRVMAGPPDGQAVNWDTAHDLAREAASAGGDPSVSAHAARQVADALGVADLWLDEVTGYPASGGQTLALSSAQWIETTWAAWQRMVAPIATSVADALGTAIARRGEQAPGEVTAGLQDAMRSIGGAVFAMQIGHAVGAMAREVMGLTDIGLPLTDPRSTGLLPSVIEHFAQGLDVPIEEVRLFLAVREAASARLFTHARWLGPHLMGAVEAYAREIEIDVDRIEEAVRAVDLSDQSQVREALAGVAAIRHTPAQQAALDRLGTTLALVEGWVDEVTRQAVNGRLPHAVGLGEMIRRRRATGGPAERTFATLVGLELRPRRAREAATLWREVAEAGGAEEREALWSHPDLLPGAEELGKPSQFVRDRAERASAEADVDAAIAKLLGGDDGAPPEPDA
jgi:putative hydrolase